MLSVGGTHFHMNGFARKTSFDTEAKDNSKMTYFLRKKFNL